VANLRLPIVCAIAAALVTAPLTVAGNAPVQVTSVGANVLITGKAKIKGNVVSAQLFRKGRSTTIVRYAVRKDGSFTIVVSKAQMKPGKYTLDLIDVTAKAMHPIVFHFAYRG
jgi:hypothetical protein